MATVDFGGPLLSIERRAIHGEGTGSIRRGRRRPAVVGEPHHGAFFAPVDVGVDHVVGQPLLGRADFV
jgi:hypothetical protein